MTTFYLDKWNKNGKKLAQFLDSNAKKEDFDILNNHIERLESIITDETKDIFNSKDSFIWLTFFDKFTKLGVEDVKFAEFLVAFKNGLRNKSVDGKLFDTVDQTGSTKDKAIINAKLHILETLLHEFLLINKEDLEEVDVLEFVKENIDLNTTQEDIEDYKEDLERLTCDVDNDTKLLDEYNLPSLLAIIAYTYKEDIIIDEWFVDFFKNTNTYTRNQKENYLKMKTNLEDYIKKSEVA